MIAWIIIIILISSWELYNMRKKDLKKEKVILIFLTLLSLFMVFIKSKYPYDISIARFALDLFGLPH
ncbi:hypothetical protein SAMN02745176_01394 [Lutispora thermophila DSM 19022]|jgi:hypothetical protein|uniref:Uncharacterized protein n=1 Tax=Lutispora thermophila DSM 19022 TaxID=1122184 RepID=A0A1M6E3I2_9FIRM|nr:hypothetical protein [Clostridiales bacterium]SHI80011.1 hypothetical protein SAMN02745176_01394 [Lutispora thermophila DSM 19022]